MSRHSRLIDAIFAGMSNLRRRARHYRSHEIIDALEPRRMLTVVVSGTGGTDEIILEVSDTHTIVSLNGQVVSNTTNETSFEIDTLGNDHVVISQLGQSGGSASVVINCGTGNDLIDVADDLFFSHI